jgi:putative endopeptidase
MMTRHGHYLAKDSVCCDSPRCACLQRERDVRADARRRGKRRRLARVPKYGTWGFDASGMDPSVKPGDDFFRYANGKWADRTQIPSDRTRYGYFDTWRSFPRIGCMQSSRTP